MASSKSKPRKKYAKIQIKTGDGKTVSVDNGISKISKKIAELDSDDSKNEFYFENVSEGAAQLIVEFYDIQLGFTEAQREKFGKPESYKEKLHKKLKENDPVKEIVDLYREYRGLPTVKFLEFMKASWDMQIEPLTFGGK